MTKQLELQKLAAEERILLAEKNWLFATLNDIKAQKIALEVEILQLNSMLKTPNNSEIKDEADVSMQNLRNPLEMQVIANKNNLEALDQAESSLNRKELDLSVGYDMKFEDSLDVSELEDSDSNLGS